MVVIAILFWLWFLVSVGILVRRSILRRRDRRARRAGTKLALHDAPATDSDADAIEPEIAETAPPVTEPAPVAATPPPPAPTRAPAATPTPEPVAAAPAPVASSVATIARAAAAPVTVAQVIGGIEMPCGLVPLTLSDHDMRYDRGQRAHFFTTLVPADVVGAALTEELERIGLTVTPIAETTALAKRGRLAVEFRIRTVGALVDGIASIEFRSAPPNSVVVEFNVVPAS